MSLRKTFAIFLAGCVVLAGAVVVKYWHAIRNSKGCSYSKNVCDRVIDAPLLDATLGLRRDRELFYVKNEAGPGTSATVSYIRADGRASPTTFRRDEQGSAIALINEYSRFPAIRRT